MTVNEVYKDVVDKNAKDVSTDQDITISTKSFFEALTLAFRLGIATGYRGCGSDKEAVDNNGDYIM